MVAVIDYDAGNLRSVEKAFERAGAKVEVTRDEGTILRADHVVLPGVGAFGDAMRKLKEYGLDPVVREVTERNIPFLGICLGLQLLFEGSYEAPGVPGLGILKGRIRRIPDAPGLKIPHMGWNELTYPNPGRLFEGIGERACVYFVHSYYLDAQEKACVKAQTEYGVTIDASVEKGNIFACQFHPEKSSDTGFAILQNFLKVI